MKILWVVCGGNFTTTRKPSRTNAREKETRSKDRTTLEIRNHAKEVEAGTVNPRTFTLRTMADRVARVGDLWSDMLGRGQGLDDAATRLARLIPETTS